MTNAFTAKPDVSWLKKAELARRNSVNSSKALNNPTAKQRIRLSPSTTKKFAAEWANRGLESGHESRDENPERRAAGNRPAA